MDLHLESVAEPAVEKLGRWTGNFVEMLPNVVAAVVALVAFWILARTVRRLVQSALDRTTHNPQVTTIAGNLAYVAVLVSGLMVALGILQLEKTVTSLLAGAGIVGLAVGFAFQDLAANFMSGFMLATSEPLRNGDVVETSSYFGTVESVHLRYSILRTFDGQLVRIPNRKIFENPLVNYTKPGERRIDIDVRIGLGEDLDVAREIAVEALESIESRRADREVAAYYTGFEPSAAVLSARLWIDYPQNDFLEARSQCVQRVKAALDEKGIKIAYPVRTLDFDEVGGRSLADSLPSREEGSA